MQKMNIGKKTATNICSILLLLPIIFTLSCNTTTTETVQEEIDTITGKISNAVSDVKDEYNEYRDDNFIKNTYKTNEEILYLLDLGMKNASDAELKKAANKMYKAHEKMGTQLRDYAATKNVNLIIEQPNNISSFPPRGIGWDKDLLDKLEQTHNKMIKNCEDAYERSQDSELKYIINNNLPLLQTHNTKIKNLQKT